MRRAHGGDGGGGRACGGGGEVAYGRRQHEQRRWRKSIKANCCCTPSDSLRTLWNRRRITCSRCTTMTTTYRRRTLCKPVKERARAVKTINCLSFISLSGNRCYNMRQRKTDQGQVVSFKKIHHYSVSNDTAGPIKRDVTFCCV